MDANEIFTIITPHACPASTARVAPFLSLVPAPTQPQCSEVPESEAHACTYPFPRAGESGAMGCSQLLGMPTWVVIQETWGSAIFGQ